MIDDPISYFPLANMHYDEFDKNLIEYLGFFFCFFWYRTALVFLWLGLSVKQKLKALINLIFYFC
jgi:hypothetical protein